MSAKPRAPRLSPNKRAELISRYEKGDKLDEGEYYVIKDKNGRLNVRRRKNKGESSDDVKSEAPAEPTPAPEPAAPAKKEKKDPKVRAL